MNYEIDITQTCLWCSNKIALNPSIFQIMWWRMFGAPTRYCKHNKCLESMAMAEDIAESLSNQFIFLSRGKTLGRMKALRDKKLLKIEDII